MINLQKSLEGKLFFKKKKYISWFLVTPALSISFLILLYKKRGDPIITVGGTFIIVSTFMAAFLLCSKYCHFFFLFFLGWHRSFFFQESNDKIEALEVRLLKADELREKLEDEVESLRVALRQAAGTVVDAASEIDRLREEHNRKLEELRAAEEEKERELALLRQESRALEEEKTQAMAKLEELNQRCLNDEKQLSDLGIAKRYSSSLLLSLFPLLLFPFSFLFCVNKYYKAFGIRNRSTTQETRGQGPEPNNACRAERGAAQRALGAHGPARGRRARGADGQDAQEGVRQGERHAGLSDGALVKGYFFLLFSRFFSLHDAT